MPISENIKRVIQMMPREGWQVGSHSFPDGIRKPAGMLNMCPLSSIFNSTQTTKFKTFGKELGLTEQESLAVANAADHLNKEPELRQALMCWFGLDGGSGKS